MNNPKNKYEIEASITMGKNAENKTNHYMYVQTRSGMIMIGLEDVQLLLDTISWTAEEHGKQNAEFTSYWLQRYIPFTEGWLKKMEVKRRDKGAFVTADAMAEYLKALRSYKRNKQAKAFLKGKDKPDLKGLLPKEE